VKVGSDETKLLGQTDESFRLLVEGVKDYAIFLLDPNGRILTWNEGAQRLKQYKPEEIIGKHFSIFYPPEDLAWDKPAFELRETLREGRFEDEGFRLRKDGSRFWANVVLTALRDETGELRGFAKITRDLTTRRAAEEQLRQSEARLRLLVESIQDYAVFMLDPSGRVATWNPGAERIKGYKPDEIIGKSFTVFYPEEDVRGGKCELELSQATANGRFEDEGWRIRKDGTRFWANVVISAVRDEKGQLLGFSKVTRDLTDRRKNEEERTARMAAEQANRSKDEFLAMLGHELRNPLAPIVTALQLMKLKSNAPPTREQVIIERQVKHMVRLVDDLLDVSRITRGKVDLQKQRLDLREVLARSIEAVSPLLEQRDHRFEIDSPPQPVYVLGDEARLTQVFVNLITNAAKYTDPGGNILVALRLAGGQAELEVRDNGVGISAELLPNVFDLFVQGGQSSDRSAGGLGIGLAVVKSLLSLHGGSIEARSAGPGQGSSFIVRLPAIPASPQASVVTPAAPEIHPAAPGRRVAAVDDNLDALELISEALTAMGHEVRTARDGPSGLAMIKEWKPEVAILDIGLPLMDGHEVAARLHAEMGAAVPSLIALTGYGQQSDRDRSALVGFSKHLVKPVDFQQLADAVTAARSR
jgi:PAS domain S-box-containing protein